MFVVPAQAGTHAVHFLAAPVKPALNSRASSGIRKLIEDLFIQRMADNDGIVTRYMDDRAFQNVAFPILTKEIFESIRAKGVAKP